MATNRRGRRKFVSQRGPASQRREHTQRRHSRLRQADFHTSNSQRPCAPGAFAYTHRQWHVVEKIGKNLPDVSVAVLAQAFIIEAVDLCNLPALVIPAQQEDAVAIAHCQWLHHSRMHSVSCGLDGT